MLYGGFRPAHPLPPLFRETLARFFASNHVSVGGEGKWVTVEDAINRNPKSQITGGRRYTFNVNKGQQVLVTGCE